MWVMILLLALAGALTTLAALAYASSVRMPKSPLFGPEFVRACLVIGGVFCIAAVLHQTLRRDPLDRPWDYFRTPLKKEIGYKTTCTFIPSATETYYVTLEVATNGSRRGAAAALDTYRPPPGADLRDSRYGIMWSVESAEGAAEPCQNEALADPALWWRTFLGDFDAEAGLALRLRLQVVEDLVPILAEREVRVLIQIDPVVRKSAWVAAGIILTITWLLGAAGVVPLLLSAIVWIRSRTRRSA